MKYYGIIAAFQRGKGPRENAKRKPKERNTKMTITEAELASLTYGCELEYEGISQERAAKVVAEVTGGTAYYEGTSRIQFSTASAFVAGRVHL